VESLEYTLCSAVADTSSMVQVVFCPDILLEALVKWNPIIPEEHIFQVFAFV
jgi:hypothetical protein